MPGHRRDEEPVHRSLGGLEKVGRFGGIEPAPASRDRELVVERQTEAEESLDGLAEREAERRRDPAVFSGADSGLLQVVARGFWLGCIEVLEQPGGEELATLAKEPALIVGQGQNPGQLGSSLATRASIGSGDPGRRESRAPKGRPTRAVRGQQALERAPREAAMPAWRREHSQAAGVAPAAQCRRGYSEHAACLGQAQPVRIADRRGAQNLPKSTRTWATRSLYQTS